MLRAENHVTFKMPGDKDSTFIFLTVRVSTVVIRAILHSKKKKNELLQICFTLASDLQVLATRFSHPGMNALAIARVGDNS